jgi:hypothetical protein
MTEREFVFWLRGYLSCGSVTLSEQQVHVVKRFLSQVNNSGPLDKAIEGQEKEYEEEIELYQTYGGD